MSAARETSKFVALRRQKFRIFFQPSRIVLGIFPMERPGKFNVITLCFDMYCSYKPAMMAFSIHKSAYTHSLLQHSTECVLAVPGESIAEQTMYCGVRSAREVDKYRECGFTTTNSENVEVPGIAEAIANIELRIESTASTGDHLTAFGKVLRFGVDEGSAERCLLSVGPRTDGYRVLARRGVHRIAVIDR